MGIRFNRHVVYGHIRYNMFCNEPTWDISPYGYQLLLSKGFHPHTNPYVNDLDEQYLLRYGMVKQFWLPTKELQYDQLNFESLYNHIQG